MEEYNQSSKCTRNEVNISNILKCEERCNIEMGINSRSKLTKNSVMLFQSVVEELYINERTIYFNRGKGDLENEPDTNAKTASFSL